MEYEINHLELGYPLCRFYHALGDLFLIKGLVHKAIDFHRNAGKIAVKLLGNTSISEELRFKLRRRQLSASYNL